MPFANFARNLGSVKSGFLMTDIIKSTINLNIYYRYIGNLKVFKYPNYNGPEIPCLRIIKKCVSINTAAANGNTKVCAL